jgi:hypothetical protein
VEDRSNEAPALSPMEGCMQASLFAGEFARVQERERPPEEPDADDARFRAQKKSPWSAEVKFPLVRLSGVLGPGPSLRARSLRCPHRCACGSCLLWPLDPRLGPRASIERSAR